LFPKLEKTVGRHLETMSRVLAWLGGFVLLAIALMTVASIIGRALIPLGLRSVPGDIELVEIFGAVAVFCFLPLCQMRMGHITVDVITSGASQPVKALLAVLGQSLLFAAIAVLAWRHWFGLQDKLQYGETTFILAVPIWIGYAGALIALVLLVATAAFTAWRAVNDLVHRHQKTERLP
jgi:TRAP-type C4-dicarboxylate transport system permease small subunit